MRSFSAATASRAASTFGSGLRSHDFRDLRADGPPLHRGTDLSFDTDEFRGECISLLGQREERTERVCR